MYVTSEREAVRSSLLQQCSWERLWNSLACWGVQQEATRSCNGCRRRMPAHGVDSEQHNRFHLPPHTSSPSWNPLPPPQGKPPLYQPRPFMTAGYQVLLGGISLSYTSWSPRKKAGKKYITPTLSRIPKVFVSLTKGSADLRWCSTPLPQFSKETGSQAGWFVSRLPVGFSPRFSSRKVQV